ncbi:hypothetical protein M9H77_04106 [Catharanthus roseus]|uniref:Uncharacterized protein n=1 Tax=Catharanthus roseus TaxID=4058 RepID=A0ACC0CDK0_CATRO|nr:hypothetical protein M9H77_04106 [Catharanthus roseus]
MKHIVKILSLLVAISALWIGLLQASLIPESYTWLLPLYFIVSLGCYGLLMVGVGLTQFPTCPQEAVLLQQVFSSVSLCVLGWGEHMHLLLTKEGKNVESYAKKTKLIVTKLMKDLLLTCGFVL